MHAKGNQGPEMTDEQIREIMALVREYGECCHWSAIDGNTFMSERSCVVSEVSIESALRAAVPAIPAGWRLVPSVPTNEWIGNLAKQQSGSLEEAPFLAIHQCIAELLEASPQAPQAAQPNRCPYCDDTGDVHSIDGEWRGTCHCPAGQAINAQQAAQPTGAVLNTGDQGR